MSDHRSDTWHIEDDGTAIDTGRKELIVTNRGVGILIEYTGYTGQFTAKGMKLAARLAKLLNEADTHACRIYAGLQPNGWPLTGLTFAQARKRATKLGFRGKAADVIAREIARRKA